MSAINAMQAPADAGPWHLCDRAASRPGRLAAWVAVPRAKARERAPIVAVHGLSRGAKDQARLLAGEAAARGRLVIAPRFDAPQWRRYQQVVTRGRADLALIALLGEIRNEFALPDRPFVLSGFSGGAQFALRFAMLHPERVSGVVATSAGWYTFPNDAPYPHGLGDPDDAPVSWGRAIRGTWARFLSLPLSVCVGAQDDRPDATLRRGDELDRVQGVGRLTRGRRFVDALHIEADAHGLPRNASFRILEGCGHDFGDCVTAGGLDVHIARRADEWDAR
jgi:pimeloyl-ACP methyl ester carboxylesterase